MSQILVVGSLAYDSIKTPSGSVERALGGSANYFSLAASLLSSVRVVGVVGSDYKDEDRNLLLSRSVDLAGLEKLNGKTFHWEGSYEDDLNEAKTLKTELNVLENFNPKVPPQFRDSSFVFLANIAPELQMRVLEQVLKPKFVGMDTMNYWISSQKAALLRVLSKVDVLLINETESEMLTDSPNAIAAASRLVAMGPRAVVIKRGEYGFALYTKEEGFHILPAFPIEIVVDPTGAGDTFAGGFFGYLAKLDRVPTVSDIKAACVSGTILASFTIQDFGVKSIARVTEGQLISRQQAYQKVVS